MNKEAAIIAIHSPRAGNGVSTIAVNLACLLASRGSRVCLADGNILTPSAACLTNLSQEQIKRGMDDFLLGECHIQDALIDLPPARFGGDAGRFAVVPVRTDGTSLSQFVKRGADFEKFNDGLQELARQDFRHVILDLPSGFSENNLLAFAVSDVLLEVSNPHVPSFEDLAAHLEIAKALEVPRILILVNLALPKYPAEDISKRYKDAFECETAAVLPMNFEVVDFSNRSFFVLEYPNHPFSLQLARCASLL